MPLPTKDEIFQAIERGNLNLPQLRGFAPVAGILGPESYSGGFCIVFPFSNGKEKKAVRIWHQEIGNIKQRYNLISSDIHKLSVPHLCNFTFEEKVFDINGIPTDVVVMDWIEGLPLKKYIQSVIDGGLSDLEKKATLKKLANMLLNMFDHFHTLGVSHGDLQHDNILVTETGNIKLIDYDCFFTKALGSNFEQTTSGYKGYQHPRRFQSGIISNEKTDYFSELILYLSVVAIAEDNTLWDIAKESDFSFLLTDQDFENISQSALANRISVLSNECQDLIGILTDYLNIQDINLLYPFGDALLDNKIKFSVSAPKIIRKKQPVVLTWNVPFEATIQIKQNAKNKKGEFSNTGQLTAKLSEDTSFTLIVNAAIGRIITKSITVSVFDECIIDFSADKKYTLPTVPVKLSWDVKHANQVWLDDEKVEANGERVVTIDHETSYVLKAQDEFGTKEEKLTIGLLPIPQVKSLMAPVPNIVSKISINVKQPRFIVGVPFPEISMGMINTEIPKVQTFTELGLNVDLSQQINRPKLTFKHTISNIYNHIIKMIKWIRI